MVVKKKLAKKMPSAPTAKQVGPIPQVSKPRSKHADEKFMTGSLGVALADANDEVVAALQEMGLKPQKKPISTAPFTPDRNRRRYLAGFVETSDHKKIVMPPADFVSSFGKKAERAPMSEEVKAKLKAKSAEKKALRPKKADGGVSIQDLCKELGIEPRDARKALRKGNVQKPDCGWYWKLREEAEAVLRNVGLIGGKANAKAEKAAKKMTKDLIDDVKKTAPKKPTKKEMKAVRAAAKAAKLAAKRTERATQLKALQAEAAEAERKQDTTQRAADKKATAAGYTHRINAWIHPASGDDYSVYTYCKGKPSKKTIKVVMRKSVVKDDFKVTELKKAR